jgi:hypothetical protein
MINEFNVVMPTAKYAAVPYASSVAVIQALRILKGQSHQIIFSQNSMAE